jgi:C1A family cysteine protease
MKYKSAEDIPSSEIPKSYDLRNINGVDFVGKVKSQGYCGSCFSFTFINVVENRLRMKHGVDKVPELSVQHLMNCNYLNEGCMGGWAIFNGFFAENAGLVEESCAPYKAESSITHC